MPSATSADTIRVLVSTDNHVGYNERDAIRGDDSWKTFNEIMCLAKDRDVDMVLLAGDLFHENKPSRKSMYQVMRSLRMNCYGEKPCELEMLSDASEQFSGSFNHVNYEDPDINVSIPVFSIHGNHDDPSGEGHLAALDILQMSGLLNYYGRTPESDNVQVKPVLLQKGQTKLALFGLSNVRDERIFRTFRDGNVKFFRPQTTQDEWFNILSVHQNHHAYTDTGYLPENFLPDFLDLVIWGHEHECKIDPITNPEKGFKVMQPGSSVATSLVEGEAVPKHVAILSITGQDFITETIRLKTVRPFVCQEVVMGNDRDMKRVAVQSTDNQPAINRYCTDLINKLIAQANQEWLDIQDPRSDDDEPPEVPLPLIRLRVDYTAPEGGNFNIDQAHRFSGRFQGQVANTSDVIQYHRKKTAAARKSKHAIEMPEETSNRELDALHVGRLVREYLTAQTLTILPQNRLGDAVIQFVDKDDKHSMQDTIEESLALQVAGLLGGEEDNDFDEDGVADQMEHIRAQLETRFQAGAKSKGSKRRSNRKPRPENWDSDLEGSWEDNPASVVRDDPSPEEILDDDDDDAESVASRPASTRGRGRGRGGRAAASTGTARKTTAAAKKAPAKPAAKKPAARGKRKPSSSEEEEEEGEPEDEDADNDVIMLDDDDDDDEVSSRNSPGLFMSQASAAPVRKAPARKAPAAKPVAKPAARKPAAANTAAARQTQLSFSQSPATGRAAASKANGGVKAAPAAPAPKRGRTVFEEEDIDDDDDAFEPVVSTGRNGRR
ncbi:hypothetical protein B0A48_16437 [Cryoendolithus antarcticus]|uniref:Double-strand break repair protein n=1 Tax=Cryoendolithus antarcticus TaxID=1507870 RepID=A0A1V8SE57_9PEZI|nr:hypothetical protein B0A48_16437 [Cryoendolithus antarcticus]